jgi:hypothetical protein
MYTSLTVNDTVASPSSPCAPPDVGGALRAAWRRCGGTTGVLVTAAPPVSFVAAGALAGLAAGIVVAGVVALAAFGLRIARHEPLGGALAGLGVTAACATVAALTGQARAFFLLPTLLPAVILLACLASVVLRRPLTGLLLNRAAGGPADWRQHRGLVRVYDVTTLVAVAINLVNAALQAVFYAADEPAVLAAAHVATGPVFATLVAATVVAVRRRLPLERAE